MESDKFNDKKIPYYARLEYFSNWALATAARLNENRVTMFNRIGLTWVDGKRVQDMLADNQLMQNRLQELNEMETLGKLTMPSVTDEPVQ